MYAVIKTGGKQYRVSEGDTIEVEHLTLKGDEAVFTPVLVVTDDGNTIYGAQALKEYAVSAKVIGEAKGDKVAVLKYRSKSGYAARSGHRQLYSLIEITSIGSKSRKEGSAKAAAGAKKASPDGPSSESGGGPETAVEKKPVPGGEAQESAN